MRLRSAIAIVIGVPLILFGLLVPASGAILAESTFDSDTDGWTAVGFSGGFLSLPVTFAPDAGNPGGALRHDDDSPSARAAFFIAPAKFITALHGAIGGSIQWDVATLPALGHTFFSITDIAIATGFFTDAITAEVTPPAPPDAPAYAEYELNFDVGAGWRLVEGEFRGDEPPPALATQAEIDAIVAGATFLLIRAEYHESVTGTPGPDVVFLDNVRVLDGVTTPVPEPAALLVLGSGLVGLGAAAWRRSRATS